MRWILVIGFVLAGVTAAHADAIDGAWCSAKGQNLQIEGPNIRTPSGARTTGHYTRHSFAYEPPADDPEAGQLIIMEQLSEEQIRLARVKDGVTSPAEDWRRCNVTS